MLPELSSTISTLGGTLVLKNGGSIQYVVFVTWLPFRLTLSMRRPWASSQVSPPMAGKDHSKNRTPSANIYIVFVFLFGAFISSTSLFIHLTLLRHFLYLPDQRPGFCVFEFIADAGGKYELVQSGTLSASVGDLCRGCDLVTAPVNDDRSVLLDGSECPRCFRQFPRGAGISRQIQQGEDRQHY